MEITLERTLISTVHSFNQLTVVLFDLHLRKGLTCFFNHLLSFFSRTDVIGSVFLSCLVPVEFRTNFVSMMRPNIAYLPIPFSHPFCCHWRLFQRPIVIPFSFFFFNQVSCAAFQGLKVYLIGLLMLLLLPTGVEGVLIAQ